MCQRNYYSDILRFCFFTYYSCCCISIINKLTHCKSKYFPGGIRLEVITYFSFSDFYGWTDGGWLGCSWCHARNGVWSRSCSRYSLWVKSLFVCFFLKIILIGVPMLKKIVGYHRCNQNLLPLYFSDRSIQLLSSQGMFGWNPVFIYIWASGLRGICLWASRGADPACMWKGIITYISHHQISLSQDISLVTQIQQQIHTACYCGLHWFSTRGFLMKDKSCFQII